MSHAESHKPLLFLDVDGVISLFGFPSTGPIPGDFHWVDGIAHCIGHEAGARVRVLTEDFELVWATGWEEKANEYLPFLLDLPAAEYPVVSFDGRAVFGSAHWKLDALDRYAAGRPAAWVDDFLDDECRAWAERRPEPTLLVQTQSPVGITDAHVAELRDWAAGLRSR